MKRDGEKGERRAKSRLEQLNQEHPDYPFAAIALAQFAASDGAFQRARDLLAPCFQLPQMHTSEAIALFAAQARLALDEKDLALAQQSLEMLRKIADEDDPQVIDLERRMEKALGRKGLRSLLPW